jgi:hypothetical protein
MKIKRGFTWLKRDFEAQLIELFKHNTVIDLATLPDFKGRDMVVKNMRIRGDIEGVCEKDLQEQEAIDRRRKEASLAEERYQQTVKAEEKHLLEILNK